MSKSENGKVGNSRSRKDDSTIASSQKLSLRLLTGVISRHNSCINLEFCSSCNWNEGILDFWVSYSTVERQERALPFNVEGKGDKDVGLWSNLEVPFAVEDLW